jgi:hypothetical protein
VGSGGEVPSVSHEVSVHAPGGIRANARQPHEHAVPRRHSVGPFGQGGAYAGLVSAPEGLGSGVRLQDCFTALGTDAYAEHNFPVRIGFLTESYHPSTDFKTVVRGGGGGGSPMNPHEPMSSDDTASPPI